jgi:hypothetical protein
LFDTVTTDFATSKPLPQENLLVHIELNIKSQGTHFIDVYILPVTSHPLILGSDYLMKNNVVLDFSMVSFVGFNSFTGTF